MFCLGQVAVKFKSGCAFFASQIPGLCSVFLHFCTLLFVVGVLRLANTGLCSASLLLTFICHVVRFASQTSGLCSAFFFPFALVYLLC